MSNSLPQFHYFLIGVAWLLITDIQLRWVSAYFPFTHPSWELEIKTNSGYSNYDDDSDSEKPEEWTEMLGCGIMRQELLERCKSLFIKLLDHSIFLNQVLYSLS